MNTFKNKYTKTNIFSLFLILFLIFVKPSTAIGSFIPTEKAVGFKLIPMGNNNFLSNPCDPTSSAPTLTIYSMLEVVTYGSILLTYNSGGTAMNLASNVASVPSLATFGVTESNNTCQELSVNNPTCQITFSIPANSSGQYVVGTVMISGANAISSNFCLQIIPPPSFKTSSAS